MAVETGQATRVAIYNRITEDVTMKSVFGITVGEETLVQLFDIMADPDPEVPYLVDRLELHGVYKGIHLYYLDLWDSNEDASPVKINQAIDRLKILLHEWGITTGDDEIDGGVMEALDYGWGWIPTDNKMVLHYATLWAVFFGAKRDITNILG